ncbi:MAG: Hsp20/alpha crystallin family protein [Planctomycetaceae bacterium]|nr:Hsp20/alpha crystallin family protein [Planctomycetaceae bacterium]
MNATLSQSQCRPQCSTSHQKTQTARPNADIYETQDAWLLIVDLPGADEQSTDVSMEKHVLTIKASVNDVVPEGFERAHTEFRSRTYERAFRLPDQVDTSAIDATVKNGVLNLKLPKSKEAMAQQVTVKGG